MTSENYLDLTYDRRRSKRPTRPKLLMLAEMSQRSRKKTKSKNKERSQSNLRIQDDPAYTDDISHLALPLRRNSGPDKIEAFSVLQKRKSKDNSSYFKRHDYKGDNSSSSDNIPDFGKSKRNQSLERSHERSPKKRNRSAKQRRNLSLDTALSNNLRRSFERSEPSLKTLIVNSEGSKKGSLWRQSENWNSCLAATSDSSKATENEEMSHSKDSKIQIGKRFLKGEIGIKSFNYYLLKEGLKSTKKGSDKSKNTLSQNDPKNLLTRSEENIYEEIFFNDKNSDEDHDHDKYLDCELCQQEECSKENCEYCNRNEAINKQYFGSLGRHQTKYPVTYSEIYGTYSGRNNAPVNAHILEFQSYNPNNPGVYKLQTTPVAFTSDYNPIHQLQVNLENFKDYGPPKAIQQSYSHYAQPQTKNKNMTQQHPLVTFQKTYPVSAPTNSKSAESKLLNTKSSSSSDSMYNKYRRENNNGRVEKQLYQEPFPPSKLGSIEFYKNQSSKPYELEGIGKLLHRPAGYCGNIYKTDSKASILSEYSIRSENSNRHFRCGEISDSSLGDSMFSYSTQRKYFGSSESCKFGFECRRCSLDGLDKCSYSDTCRYECRNCDCSSSYFSSDFDDVNYHQQQQQQRQQEGQKNNFDGNLIAKTLSKYDRISNTSDVKQNKYAQDFFKHVNDVKRSIYQAELKHTIEINKNINQPKVAETENQYQKNSNRITDFNFYKNSVLENNEIKNFNKKNSTSTTSNNNQKMYVSPNITSGIQQLDSSNENILNMLKQTSHNLPITSKLDKSIKYSDGTIYMTPSQSINRIPSRSDHCDIFLDCNYPKKQTGAIPKDIAATTAKTQLILNEKNQKNPQLESKVLSPSVVRKNQQLLENNNVSEKTIQSLPRKSSNNEQLIQQDLKPHSNTLSSSDPKEKSDKKLLLESSNRKTITVEKIPMPIKSEEIKLKHRNEKSDSISNSSRNLPITITKKIYQDGKIYQPIPNKSKSSNDYGINERKYDSSLVQQRDKFSRKHSESSNRQSSAEAIIFEPKIIKPKRKKKLSKSPKKIKPAGGAREDSDIEIDNRDIIQIDKKKIISNNDSKRIEEYFTAEEYSAAEKLNNNNSIDRIKNSDSNAAASADLFINNSNKKDQAHNIKDNKNLILIKNQDGPNVSTLNAPTKTTTTTTTTAAATTTTTSATTTTATTTPTTITTTATIIGNITANNITSNNSATTTTATSNITTNTVITITNTSSEKALTKASNTNEPENNLKTNVVFENDSQQQHQQQECEIIESRMQQQQKSHQQEDNKNLTSSSSNNNDKQQNETTTTKNLTGTIELLAEDIINSTDSAIDLLRNSKTNFQSAYKAQSSEFLNIDTSGTDDQLNQKKLKTKSSTDLSVFSTDKIDISDLPLPALPPKRRSRLRSRTSSQQQQQQQQRVLNRKHQQNISDSDDDAEFNNSRDAKNSYISKRRESLENSSRTFYDKLQARKMQFFTLGHYPTTRNSISFNNNNNTSQLTLNSGEKRNIKSKLPSKNEIQLNASEIYLNKSGWVQVNNKYDDYFVKNPNIKYNQQYKQDYPYNKIDQKMIAISTAGQQQSLSQKIYMKPGVQIVDPKIVSMLSERPGFLPVKISADIESPPPVTPILSPPLEFQDTKSKYRELIQQKQKNKLLNNNENNFKTNGGMVFSRSFEYDNRKIPNNYSNTFSKSFDSELKSPTSPTLKQKYRSPNFSTLTGCSPNYLTKKETILIQNSTRSSPNFQRSEQQQQKNSSNNTLDVVKHQNLLSPLVYSMPRKLEKTKTNSIRNDNNKIINNDSIFNVPLPLKNLANKSRFRNNNNSNMNQRLNSCDSGARSDLSNDEIDENNDNDFLSASYSSFFKENKGSLTPDSQSSQNSLRKQQRSLTPENRSLTPDDRYSNKKVTTRSSKPSSRSNTLDRKKKYHENVSRSSSSSSYSGRGDYNEQPNHRRSGARKSTKTEEHRIRRSRSLQLAEKSAHKANSHRNRHNNESNVQTTDIHWQAQNQGSLISNFPPTIRANKLLDYQTTTKINFNNRSSRNNDMDKSRSFDFDYGSYVYNKNLNTTGKLDYVDKSRSFDDNYREQCMNQLKTGIMLNIKNPRPLTTNLDCHNVGSGNGSSGSSGHTRQTSPQNYGTRLCDHEMTYDMLRRTLDRSPIMNFSRSSEDYDYPLSNCETIDANSGNSELNFTSERIYDRNLLKSKRIPKINHQLSSPNDSSYSLDRIHSSHDSITSSGGEMKSTRDTLNSQYIYQQNRSNNGSVNDYQHRQNSSRY